MRIAYNANQKQSKTIKTAKRSMDDKVNEFIADFLSIHNQNIRNKKSACCNRHLISAAN